MLSFTGSEAKVVVESAVKWAAHEFIQILFELRDEGKAILMSTHDIFRAKEIADRIGIMREGVLLTEIRPEEIKNENIEKLYLQYMESPLNL